MNNEWKKFQIQMVELYIIPSALEQDSVVLCFILSKDKCIVLEDSDQLKKKKCLIYALPVYHLTGTI